LEVVAIIFNKKKVTTRVMTSQVKETEDGAVEISRATMPCTKDSKGDSLKKVTTHKSKRLAENIRPSCGESPGQNIRILCVLAIIGVEAYHGCSFPRQTKNSLVEIVKRVSFFAAPSFESCGIIRS
jgi:hypothetical protein